MKVKVLTLSSLFFIICLYSCDNREVNLESHTSIEPLTISGKAAPDQNFRDMGDTMDDEDGSGGEVCYAFEKGNFEYKISKGPVLFTLSYDKNKKLYPIISVIKISSSYNTKYNLLECSVTGVKYDTNNDLLAFNVIVKYDIYKNVQVIGKSTDYHYVYNSDKRYLLKYIRKD
ncbi:hypothetical protein [uncultured Bacteroides sp.]|uniref:hypothetical protein n=1 Tax=uncultured Bacteroides sp. TaxID=162156 RepID=UPI002AAB3763|nr:hypothetical protein [uncultured Bacteroides sp.]